MVRMESKGKEEMEEMPLKAWDPTTPIENAWLALLRSELKISRSLTRTPRRRRRLSEQREQRRKGRREAVMDTSVKRRRVMR